MCKDHIKVSKISQNHIKVFKIIQNQIFIPVILFFG